MAQDDCSTTVMPAQLRRAPACRFRLPASLARALGEVLLRATVSAVALLASLGSCGTRRIMGLLGGVHHVTFLTEDIDRLTAFYERIFDADKTLDMIEEGVRHIFLDVGATTVLHPFQIINGPALPPAPGAMFRRGRLDHFALSASSAETFREIYRRLASETALDGEVRDMRTMWILGFHDPDGFYVEVIWRKPDSADSETLERARWTTVEF
jgi:catechol 2,3-dioxygenase-like lactoylglutathione lyase family enzyme